MKRRWRKAPAKRARELWEGITPDNMNQSIRDVETILNELDPSNPEWGEAYEFLEAMNRYREDLRGD